MSQVTKSGYSAACDALRRFAVLPVSLPGREEKKDERLEELLVAGVSAEPFDVFSDGVLEAADGTEDDAVEGVLASNLLIAAGFAELLSCAPAAASDSEVSSAVASPRNIC